jgi:hypothetical protein
VTKYASELGGIFQISKIPLLVLVMRFRDRTTFKLEGEVTSLSESSKGEMEDKREKSIKVENRKM